MKTEPRFAGRFYREDGVDMVDFKDARDGSITYGLASFKISDPILRDGIRWYEFEDGWYAVHPDYYHNLMYTPRSVDGDAIWSDAVDVAFEMIDPSDADKCAVILGMVQLAEDARLKIPHGWDKV